MDEIDMRRLIKYIVIGAIALILLILLFGSLRTVPTGYVGVKTIFGKVQNEKEISIAEKDVKVMNLQNKEITEKTLQLKKLEVQEKLINKWDGKLPSTTLGDNIPILNLGK